MIEENRIGKNLKRIRERNKLGINELSRISDVNASYISAIERGVKCNPSPKILNKLALALEIDELEFYKDNYIYDEVSQEQNNDGQIKEKEAPSLLEGANEDTLDFFTELEKMGLFSENMTKEEQEYLINIIKAAMKKPN